MILSIHTLPIEIVYRVFNEVDDLTLFTSCQNSVTTLDLWLNNVGNIGTQHLANTLLRNETLTTLKLHRNELGPQEVEYLTSDINNQIGYQGTLSILEIGSYDIDSQGAKYTLASLSIYRNCIGLTGAEYLANDLLHNRTLTKLNMILCQIYTNQRQHITAIFNRIPQLKYNW